MSPHRKKHLVVRNADLGRVVTAVRAAFASKEWVVGPVVWPAVGIKDTCVIFVVQVLVAEEAQLVRR